MADGWTDTRHRSLINFLVYCPREMVFVKSVDASEIMKSSKNLFKLFDEVVTWVGSKNIVHMVTDNASNYVSAGKLLCEKYKTISWSPCAAHCLNLVLKDMGDMPHVDRLKERASKVTIFIYNHVQLIAWLRNRPGWIEIVRLRATRFAATTFLAFGSIHVHKHDLQALVTSKFFVDNRSVRELKAKEAVSIILDNSFWDDINDIVKISSPLIHLLRIVDSDQRPTIGYVYEDMYGARLGIKKIFQMKKHLYKPYTSIIKNRWDKHLLKDLHAAAYWLNSAFQYDEENFCRKPAVNIAILDYIGKKYDGDQEKVIKEIQYFEDRIGSFDRDLALSTSKTTHPDEWWKLWGVDVPNLQKLAIRILSQTSASFGYDSSEVEGIDLGTFGQPIGPPPGFSGNDVHDNFHDIDDL
ncbi:hypothetical protein SO802_000057 [Lithocarpus litseifolius]|uniref:DUF659 domain-containing protein n=1 Tax=Lithocarpus litseifolius TaxID=425828 RepID=A0AAW2DTV7_9ROSI